MAATPRAGIPAELTPLASLQIEHPVFNLQGWADHGTVIPLAPLATLLV
jgi:hypothetical protein